MHRRWWRGILLCVFVLAARDVAMAASLDLTQDAISSDFGREVDVLIDAPETMTAGQALVSSDLAPYPEPLVNLGSQSSPAWIRFDVSNGTGVWGAWVLNTLRSNVEVLEIYKATEEGTELLFDNAHDEQRRQSLQRYFNLVAPFSLAPYERATLLIRYKAAIAGWLPMRVIPTSMLTRFTFSQFSLFIFSTAGTGVLIFFNLLLFLATRDRTYVVYTAATSALLVVCLHLQGMTTAWWFYASPEWSRVFGATMINLSAVMLLTFARYFLELQGRWLADYWYRFAMLLMLGHIVLLSLSMFVAPTYTDLLVTSGWATSIAVFVSLPLQAFFANRGWRLEETLLGVAWTVLAVQFVTFMLSNAGVLPGGYMDWYLLGPACFTEAALVAVSIALRVRRLQLEKEASDVRSKLALQEMNERARLVLAASHDARNLVGGALSLSRHATDARNLDAARANSRKVGEVLESLAQTMNLMVSSSRQVGATAIPMIESVNVAELLETLALTFRDRAGETGKRISWRSDRDAVACDRHMLVRVLSNLIANAIAYSRGVRILVVCRSHLDHVSLRVYDQGPGLSSTDLQRVLGRDRSVRLSPHSEGVGVGLRTCDELASAFGGELEAASNPEGGTMFGLRLPLPELPRSINFLGDADLWGSYAALLQGSRLVDEHGGEARALYVFSESVDVRDSDSINVVACYDRSNENRDRWARLADAILCFPVTLPALAYAAALACRRGESGAMS